MDQWQTRLPPRNTYTQLLKVNDAGDVLWSRTRLTFSDRLLLTSDNNMIQTSSGDYVVILGYFLDTNNIMCQLVCRTSNDGSIKWLKGYRNVFYSGIKEAGDNYILAGMHFDSSSTNILILTMIDSSGNLLQEFNVSGLNYNSLRYNDHSPFSHDIDNISVLFPSNNSALYYNLYTGPSGGVYHRPFMVKTEPGYYSNCYHDGNNIRDTMISFNIDTSYISDPISFTSQDITSDYISAPASIQSMDNCALLASINSAITNRNPFILYPNPNSGKFTIQLPDNFDKEEFLIRILNIYGQLIFEVQTKKSDKIQIELENINNGVYFLELTGSDLRSSQKMLIKN